MTENTAKNLSHWNEAASTYNTKFSKTIQQIIDEIQARKEWIGVDWVDESSDGEEVVGSSSKEPKRTVRLLDYACGTGLVSRALAPYITSSIGIDLTPNMVHEYNTSASNQGIPSHEMHAVLGNLLDPSNPDPEELKGEEFWEFDIAVVGLGFHHFDDPGFAAKQLGRRLKKGGVLMIVDFLPHGAMNAHHHQHAAAKTVTHLGFSESDVKKMFQEAGVGEGFEYVVVGKGVVFGNKGEEGYMERSVFMARGAKL